MSIVILWALALLVLQPALAAEPRQQPTAREQARTVTIFHQPVVMLQATFGQTTPEERVLRTRSALRAFTEDDIRQPLRVVPVIRYGQPQTVSDERQTGAAAEPRISTRAMI
ncbi:hypothetical protein KPZU09_16390 [Klebsiella pneumoniae]|uniref:Mechanosensitive ion channel protein MscS n=1 Tax=Klebsiella pneumoniae TaxID=573 RepID=A0A919HNS1_KLEPN|nr:hypothetical protein KPZU09_16390 [Klebsiella pneumoniae]